MNTQKEITFTDLRAKFTKDFDTFGKMDPFVEFTVGKCIARTETANSAGKEPQWKNPIVLNYFDETVITLRSYDEDATENQFMGAGKVEIKGLRFPGGAIDVNLLTDSGENIGVISGKYTIKNLNPTPLLLIKNVRCSFVKEHTFIAKTKPYLQLNTQEGQVNTEAKEEAQGLLITWSEGLRLRLKENSKIIISLLDKNDNGTHIFKYQCSAREFRLQSGTRRFNIFGADYLYLGTVQFDFETVNLVSKEESVKNAEKEKKSQSELTSIFVQKVKTQLKSEGKDLYYHFVVGTNKVATDVTKSVPANSSIDLKRVLYADSRQNKMTILIWQSNLLRDKVIAWANIPLQGLASGEKKVALTDTDGKDAGNITLSLTVKQVPAKVVLLDGLVVELAEGADIIGESEPYVVAKLGGASGRTETGDKNTYSFKRGIELKCGDEDLLELQIWEEDVTNDELVYTQKVKLSDLKGTKGEQSFKMAKVGENIATAKLTIKYELKINAPSEPPKKLTEKKPVEAPKVDPPSPAKVQPVPEVKPQIKPEPKVEPVPEPKKEEKKDSPKKQEIKPKFQQIKPHPEPIPPISKTLQQSQHSDYDSRRKRKTEDNNDDSRIPRSLNKDSSAHRESMLPSIVSSHLNYGDRIFEKQSAATLQKSIVAYTMPKANRFSNEPKYTGEPSYCIDSCFKSNSLKGVGFGFGRKKQFPDWVQRNMKEIPPPSAYFENSSELRPKGPTFGIAHKYYEKVLIPKEKPAGRTLTNRKLSPIREHK